ncbi:hypothetical protein DMB66_56555 [Actinoplanes sp. ATCC 53533]|nr:hypothetical protein DMB66_56555 [Actinoplanes sp. ATCC 53533]
MVAAAPGHRADAARTRHSLGGAGEVLDQAWPDDVEILIFQCGDPLYEDTVGSVRAHHELLGSARQATESAL